MARAARSGLELKLDATLKALFSKDKVLHDFPIKVGARTLFVDRVVCSRKLAFEIDGSQHQEFSFFYHKTSEGFASHKERDRLKSEWLYDNGYTLVRLKHTDKLDPASVRAKVLEALNA